MPLGERATYGDSKYVGISLDPDLGSFHEALQESLDGGFDFVLVPLRERTNQDWHSTHDIDNETWRTRVVARTSIWEEDNVSDPSENFSFQSRWKEELERCVYLGLQAALVTLPLRKDLHADLARIVLRHLNKHACMQVWMSLPISSASDEHGSVAWDAWHRVRTLCDAAPNLGCVLEVGPMLPRIQDVKRWMAEPLMAILLDTSAFRTNQAGYPSFCNRHSTLIKMAFLNQVQVILAGENRHPVHKDGYEDALSRSLVHNHKRMETGRSPRVHALHNYMEYLAYLFNDSAEPSDDDAQEIEYRDHLQIPLQPLMDNLQNGTYEVFERDAIKYDRYCEAITKCLRDLRDHLEGGRRAILSVVGAGRGPLVRACILASMASDVKVHIYAVEKNPNAVITLQHLIKEQNWEDMVTLVDSDMRTWNPSEEIDILVSELLGSFGDNELSPECIDGVLKCLRKSGVSIPCSYTSYLQPISASKVYKSIKAYNNQKSLETPYVVKLHSVYPIAPPKPTFTFTHHRETAKQPNKRSITHCFSPSVPDLPCLCHGFAGYFSAVLYADVTLSTHPDSHTDGMQSWFPIFFPLIRPVEVQQNQPISIQMWRCVNPTKVWYEWAVLSPEILPIQNPEGRSYWVGLSPEE